MTDPTDSSSKEPVAGISAASSCIRISLRSSPPSPHATPSFRPVYTHQCFEKECVTGWRPYLDAERQSQQIYRSWKGGISNDGNNDIDGLHNLHPSYQRCRHDDRLDIHVRLSPSCENCNVEIQTEKCAPTTKHDNDGKDEPAPKRVKIVSFAETGGPGEDNAQDVKQMDMKDIVHQISISVPPILSVTMNGTVHNELLPAKDDERGDAKADSTNECAVRWLKTYHRKTKGSSESTTEESKFIIALADGSDPKVARYHKAIQPLARWFIETADDVDLSDTSKGSWNVMYLFRCHDSPPSGSSSSSRLSLVGYITLLHVHSPFRQPIPGIIVRICQALILPPYHRAGHGSEMLRCIHEYADRHEENAAHMYYIPIVEVNVEDPAPGFVALRDSVDYQRFVSLCSPSTNEGNGSEKANLDYLNENDVTKKEYYLPISEENLLKVAEALKVTKRQAQVVHEVYKLAKVEEWKRSLSKDANDTELIEDIEKNYRLMVKKSLRSYRLEELGACDGDKEKQKALLGEWFEETLSHYRRLLRLQS